MPDFRNVLTWQPDIQTDHTGKAALQFFTSDSKGNFVGVVHGIDEMGNAATKIFQIDVSK
jgi:hypothetical protein